MELCKDGHLLPVACCIARGQSLHPPLGDLRMLPGIWREACRGSGRLAVRGLLCNRLARAVVPGGQATLLSGMFWQLGFLPTKPIQDRPAKPSYSQEELSGSFYDNLDESLTQLERRSHQQTHVGRSRFESFDLSTVRAPGPILSVVYCIASFPFVLCLCSTPRYYPCLSCCPTRAEGTVNFAHVACSSRARVFQRLLLDI